MKLKRTCFSLWFVIFPNGNVAAWSGAELKKESIGKFIEGVDGMPWSTHFRRRGYRCVKCLVTVPRINNPVK